MKKKDRIAIPNEETAAPCGYRITPPYISSFFVVCDSVPLFTLTFVVVASFFKISMWFEFCRCVFLLYFFCQPHTIIEPTINSSSLRNRIHCIHKTSKSVFFFQNHNFFRLNAKNKEIYVLR